MPLIDAAQAQKHVTINEAILRMDALGASRVESRSFTSPPETPEDGTAYIVGKSASDLWETHDEEVAIYQNGGWRFVSPWDGLKIWVADEATNVCFQLGSWNASQLSSSVRGAQTICRTIEFEHTLDHSPTSSTGTIIPDKATVIGVTGRVILDITGPTSWSLGVSGSPDRYGSGYGTSTGSFAHGMTGQPQTYFGSTALEITSDGIAFSAGVIRLAIHVLEIKPPTL